MFQPQRSSGIFQPPPIFGISQPQILSQQGPSIFKLVDEVMRGGAQGGCAFATSRQRSTLEASEPPALAKMMPSAFFNSHWAANATENQSHSKNEWLLNHLGTSWSPLTPKRPLATRSPITTRSLHAYRLKMMAHAKTATFCSVRSGDTPLATQSGVKCILQSVELRLYNVPTRGCGRTALARGCRVWSHFLLALLSYSFDPRNEVVRPLL